MLHRAIQQSKTHGSGLLVREYLSGDRPPRVSIASAASSVSNPAIAARQIHPSSSIPSAVLTILRLDAS